MCVLWIVLRMQHPRSFIVISHPVFVKNVSIYIFAYRFLDSGGLLYL